MWLPAALMTKLWQIVIAKLVSSSWSSPLCWFCADMYVWICDIPKRRIEFTRKEIKWICGAKSYQKRWCHFSALYLLLMYTRNQHSLLSSLPLLMRWSVICCHHSAGNSVKLHLQEKYRHLTVLCGLGHYIRLYTVKTEFFFNRRVVILVADKLKRQRLRGVYFGTRD